MHQWMPLHCGTVGNEAAGRTAEATLKNANCRESNAPPFQDARLLMHGTICSRTSRTEDRTHLHLGSICGQAGAVLHRLRTDSALHTRSQAKWQNDAKVTAAAVVGWWTLNTWYCATLNMKKDRHHNKARYLR